MANGCLSEGHRVQVRASRAVSGLLAQTALTPKKDGDRSIYPSQEDDWQRTSIIILSLKKIHWMAFVHFAPEVQKVSQRMVRPELHSPSLPSANSALNDNFRVYCHESYDVINAGVVQSGRLTNHHVIR